MSRLSPDAIPGYRWSEDGAYGLGEASFEGVAARRALALVFEPELARRAPMIDDAVANRLASPPPGVAGLIARGASTLVFDAAGAPLVIVERPAAPRAAVQLVVAACHALTAAGAAGLRVHGGLAPHRLSFHADAGLSLIGFGAPPLGVYGWVDGVGGAATGVREAEPDGAITGDDRRTGRRC